MIVAPQDITWQEMTITKRNRMEHLKQKPKCIWFTGLSGSGKSTIANALERRLFKLGYNTYLLDGDNLRHGLNRDLSFTEADRAENIRRAAEVAHLMVDAGLIVIASFISPILLDRLKARELFERGEFFEIFLDTPLNICEERDPKGLYAKCRRGEIENFTGISSAYQRPPSAEITLDTSKQSIQECVDLICNTVSID